jgi:hypothetical protein
LSTSEEVDVEVEDTLLGLRSVVDHQAIPVRVLATPVWGARYRV